MRDDSTCGIECYRIVDMLQDGTCTMDQCYMVGVTNPCIGSSTSCWPAPYKAPTFRNLVVVT